MDSISRKFKNKPKTNMFSPGNLRAVTEHEGYK